MIEVEYSNPNSLTAGDWQISLAEAITENTVSVERDIQQSTLVVRCAADEVVVREAIETHLPNAVHVETRDPEDS